MTITVSGSDADTGDSLTFIITSLPRSGDLVAPGQIHPTSRVPTGDTVTYIPDAGFSGADSFTFKVNDGGLDSDQATVTVNVTPAGSLTLIVTKTGDSSDRQQCREGQRRRRRNPQLRRVDPDQQHRQRQ